MSILDGQTEITVGGELHRVEQGEAVLMPGGVSHALVARERFTMSLVMLKREA